jgi:hypothetical protein
VPRLPAHTVFCEPKQLAINAAAFKDSTRIVGKQEVARNGIVENDAREHVYQNPIRQNRPYIARAKSKEWWALKDLNLRPTDYESAALTAELRARPLFTIT